jgi:CubicO group peptidase (beta-lactamase class C family)
MIEMRLRDVLLVPALAALVVFAAQARSLYDFTPVANQVQVLMQAYGLSGASMQLSKDGQTVYRQDFGTYGPGTRIAIASASKWLSALVIARLVERGQMRWDDTIGQYIPDAPTDKRGIALRQLFSHTSGLPGGDSDCLSQRTVTLDTCARQILQFDLIAAPGTAFAYGGNSMQVAGRLAEIATGKSWDQLFVAELVVPLGLTGTDFATGSIQPGYVFTVNPRIAGGVRSTVDDYSKVVTMVAMRGATPGGQFLSPDTLDYMARKHSAGTTVLSTPYANSLGYGIGQWREAEDARGVAFRVSSPGAFGAYPFADTRQGVAGFYLVRGVMSEMQADEIALMRLCLKQLDFVRYQTPLPAPTSPTTLAVVFKPAVETAAAVAAHPPVKSRRSLANAQRRGQ